MGKPTNLNRLAGFLNHQQYQYDLQNSWLEDSYVKKSFPPNVNCINQSPLYTPMVISELVQVLKVFHPLPFEITPPFPLGNL